MEAYELLMSVAPYSFVECFVLAHLCDNALAGQRKSCCCLVKSLEFKCPFGNNKNR